MKQQFASLSELAARIDADRKSAADFVVQSPALAMQDDATVAIGSSERIQEVLPTGHRQIATLLDIPADYYERMRANDPRLLAANVNRWMGARPTSERRMVRSLGGKIRAVLSDSYRRIDNHEVAEVALNVLSDIKGLRIASCAVTDTRMTIKAVASSVEMAVPGSKRVGDLVQAGVMIANSEIGMGSLGIRPFAEFLVCTNGMVRDAGALRMAHIGRKVDASVEGLLSDGTKRLEDEVVLRKVRDVIAGAFNEVAFKRFIDGLGATTEQRIEGDVPAVIEALGPASTGLGLNMAERNSVLKHLIEGGDLSRYGLINAVTRTAEDADHYDRATELETLGYRLVELPQRDWARISNAKQ